MLNEILHYEAELNRVNSERFNKAEILFRRGNNSLIAITFLFKFADEVTSYIDQGYKDFEVAYTVETKEGSGNYAGRYFTNVVCLGFKPKEVVRDGTAMEAYPVIYAKNIPEEKITLKDIVKNDNEPEVDDLPF